MHPFDRLEKNRETSRKYRRNKRKSVSSLLDWLVLRLENIKGRAKSKGLSFDLAEEDVKINQVCPVFNRPIILDNEDRNFRPSIDRIDNSRGYEKGNVRMISWRANWLKSNMTYEEVKLLYENWNKV